MTRYVRVTDPRPIIVSERIDEATGEVLREQKVYRKGDLINADDEGWNEEQVKLQIELGMVERAEAPKKD